MNASMAVYVFHVFKSQITSEVFFAAEVCFPQQKFVVHGRNLMFGGRTS